MKPSTQDIQNLKRRISAQYRARGINCRKIGQLTGVHPSQVWRICSGQFQTISSNVVQVCKELGVEVETVKGLEEERDAFWSRLEGSLRNLWDQTPEGARRIEKILDSMAELRGD